MWKKKPISGLKAGGRLKIILAIIIFSAIVLFHELGHFLLAKKNGIVVTESVSYTHLTLPTT